MNTTIRQTASLLLLGVVLLSGCLPTGELREEDPALNNLKAQVAANPQDPQTRAKLVDAYLQRFNETKDPAYRDDAIRELHLLTGQHPNLTGANIALYRLLVGLSLEQSSTEHLDELRGIYQRTALLKETPIAPPALVEGLIALHGVKHKAQLRAVIHTVHSALKENPRHVGTRILLAKLYTELGQDALALAMLEQAYQLAPDSPLVLHDYGMRLTDRVREARCEGDYRHLDQALTVVKQATAKLPKDPELQQDLARLYETRGAFELALFASKRRHELQADADSGSALAESYAEANQIPKAIDLLQELIHKYPDDADLLNRLAHVYFQDKQWRNANTTFVKYLQQTHDIEPYAMIWLSLSDQVLRDKQAAVRHLQAIPQQSFSNDWERTLVAYLRGDLEEGQLLAKANNACEQAEAYYYSGFQKWLHEDRPGARAAFEKVVALHVPYFYEHHSAVRLLRDLDSQVPH